METPPRLLGTVVFASRHASTVSEIHQGLVVARERPQAFSRLASIFAALSETLAELAVKSVRA